MRRSAGPIPSLGTCATPAIRRRSRGSATGLGTSIRTIIPVDLYDSPIARPSSGDAGTTGRRRTAWRRPSGGALRSGGEGKRQRPAPRATAPGQTNPHTLTADNRKPGMQDVLTPLRALATMSWIFRALRGDDGEDCRRVERGGGQRSGGGPGAPG